MDLLKAFNLFVVAALISSWSIVPASAAPKKLLVVSITTGYRHGSIKALQKLLTQLAQSSGEFSLDFLDQPPGKPAEPKKDATPAEKDANKAAEAKWEESQLKPALAKLAPAQLHGYDGVVFASTTGDLPLPDPQGFLDWIKAGHAFIGLHSASDTLHHWPTYADMLGGEFDHHGKQVSVDLINADPQHPATAGLPKVWTLTQEEIYQFKKSYDPAKVHELLYLDKSPETGVPGHYPIAWCKNYGQGRVFYTALGHRDDLIDPDPAAKDRKNAPDISRAYDAHVLGGIEWALGLKPGSSAASAAATTAADPHALLDSQLTAWELWMGVPHHTVTGLPRGTPTSLDGHAGIPLGLNNDPKHVFSIKIQDGEPVLHITGEIFGGLTTKASYSNYHLHAEFRWGQLKWEPKLTVKRDNGILFDCTGPHGAFWKVWKRSIEFQVEEGNMGDIYLLSGTGATLPIVQTKPKQWFYDPAGAMSHVGAGENSVTGKVAHLVGTFEKPNGEWNDLDLYCIGRAAVFVVNGNVDNVLRDTMYVDGPQKTEVPLNGGQIQIQSEGAECDYRRMTIEPIADYPAEIKSTAKL